MTSKKYSKVNPNRGKKNSHPDSKKENKEQSKRCRTLFNEIELTAIQSFFLYFNIKDYRFIDFSYIKHGIGIKDIILDYFSLHLKLISFHFISG